MKQWFAVYTQSNAEQLALLNLRNQGFDTYLPRYRRTRRHARRTEQVLRPLFPRYVFVEIDIDVQAWNCVNGTRGVVGIVCSGDRPAAVPDRVMTALRSREANDGTISLAPPELKQGDRLQFIDDALNNIVGLFECMVDSERAMLLIDLLGRTVRVRAPVNKLAPVS